MHHNGYLVGVELVLYVVEAVPQQMLIAWWDVTCHLLVHKN